MRSSRILARVAAGVLSTMLLAAPGRGQTPSAAPADVQAIMQKLRSGKSPTAAEEKRLAEWVDSVTAGVSGPKRSGAGGAGAAQKGGAPSALGALGKMCPPPGAAKLASTAPTAPEYAALLKALVTRYGAKLDPQTKIKLDTDLAGPAAAAGNSRGGSYGAFLNAAGAIDEAIYAAALAARRDPGDLLAANNLGVNLSEAGDHEASAQVLLHVTKTRPRSPLASVNLAWTYFNAGAGAAAQKEFQRAQGLAPDMAAPEAGLGLIAGCRGDSVAAARLLKSSLDKGYSKVAAVAFGRARASQPPSQEKKAESQEKGRSQDGSSSDARPPRSSGSELIPDLPLHPEPQRNEAQAAQLKRVSSWAERHRTDLQQRYQDALARVQALNRRARVSGDAIDLPLVFDRELFEYGQAVDLTFGARFGNVEPVSKRLGAVMNTNVETHKAIMVPALQRLNQQQKDLLPLLEEWGACGNNEACRDAAGKKIAAKQAEIDESNYQICLHNKQTMDVALASHYKLWRANWDAFRPAAADLYAFTDPILERVWVPSLHEMLQLQRELQVVTWYEGLSREAAGLAESAKAYRGLKCVPPPPPPPPGESADTPNLPPEKKSNCPFGKPASAGCGLLSMTLSCDEVTISGGEVIRFKANRNFKTHETTLWGGVGASAEAKMDLLGPMSPKAELSAEAGFGAKFGPDGSVSDVFVTSELRAGVGVGGKSVDIGVSGQAALEGGASLTAELPGGISGGVRQ